jgi:hypothetical protein
VTFQLIDPITKGVIHIKELTNWCVHDIMRSPEEHENKRWQSNSMWIDQTDPMFKDARLDKTPLTGGFELRDQMGNLFDFVRIKFSTSFINDGDRIKTCEEMWLEPLSNIEFCQLVMKKTDDTLKDDLQFEQPAGKELAKRNYKRKNNPRRKNDR